MFRIKPTRNQTTAKQTNLSPHPVAINNLISNKRIQNRNNLGNVVMKNRQGNQTGKRQSLVRKIVENNPKTIQKKQFYPQIIQSKVNQFKNQKIDYQKINQVKKIQQNKASNNKFNLINKPNSRLFVRRSSNLTKNNNLNKINLNNQINNNLQKNSQNHHENHRIINKNQIKSIQVKEQIKQIKNIDNKPVIKDQKLQNKQIREQKQQNDSKQEKQQNNQVKVEEKIQQTLKQQLQVQNDQNQKQKQLQDAMQKIRIRRQTREKQKKRLLELQQKQKQNLQKAEQFLASRNNQPNGQYLGGMIKLNDQLMHFSLAQSILDLQIKKLIKTKFDEFPNFSQIKYQIEELQRIDMSYQMIKFDESNSLKNGLKNYRVEIFNRIGQLILQAQQQGYSNPNFHIMQADVAYRNPHLPEIVRGLPKQNHSQFIKFTKSQVQIECAICLSIVEKGQISAQLQCRHIFHGKCIKDWILSSANCPTCRYNIKFGHKKPK